MGLFSGIENVLEKCHIYCVADRLRRFEMCLNAMPDNQLEWRESCYAEERTGFSIIQRENYLKEEMQRLEYSQVDNKLTTEENAAKLEALQKELEGMGQMYWFHERKMSKLEREKPDGVWVRDWNAKRRRMAEKAPRISVRGVAQKIHPPQLELVKPHGRLVYHIYWDASRRKPAIADAAKKRALCAQRGGCCASDCGCCEEYFRSHDLDVWARGHCTMACGCCVKRRGFYRFNAVTLSSRGLGRGDVPWDSGI